MRDISTVTGQELPSSQRLIVSTLLALGVAAAILVVAVLPAEYGLDPTGLGQKMGLTALSQSAPAQQTDRADQTKPEPVAVAVAPAAPAVMAEPVQRRDDLWQSETLGLTLPPKQGLEVKALMDQGEKLLFHWQVEGGSVSFDMHGNVVDAEEDDFTSYWLGDDQAQAAGTFTAPFTGLHGWWWENKGDKPVTVVLKVEGYYRELK